MLKIRVKLIPKLLVFSSILIISIHLFISITKDYVAHKYYLKYKQILNNKKQDPDGRIHFLSNTLKNSPLNADAVFELGKSYIAKMPDVESTEEKNELFNIAKNTFLNSLKLKPTDGIHWAMYAWYIGLKGETNEAIECFDKAMYLSKSDFFTHQLYASWCVNLVKRKIDFENSSRCTDINENFLKLDNQFINGIRAITFVETAQMEWDKAISLKATRNDAAFNNIVYNSLAELALIKCDIDSAIGYYIATNNRIMLAKCHLMKAECHFMKGDYISTVGILESIIKNGGNAFSDNLEVIKKLLGNVIVEDMKNIKALYLSGELYSILGMTKKTMQYLSAIVKLYPKHIEAHLKLAKIYESTDQTDLAVEEYETIMSLNPDHKEAFDALGEIIRRNY